METVLDWASLYRANTAAIDSLRFAGLHGLSLLGGLYLIAVLLLRCVLPLEALRTGQGWLEVLRTRGAVHGAETAEGWIFAASLLMLHAGAVFVLLLVHSVVVATHSPAWVLLVAAGVALGAARLAEPVLVPTPAQLAALEGNTTASTSWIAGAVRVSSRRVLGGLLLPGLLLILPSLMALGAWRLGALWDQPCVLHARVLGWEAHARGAWAASLEVVEARRLSDHGLGAERAVPDEITVIAQADAHDRAPVGAEVFVIEIDGQWVAAFPVREASTAAVAPAMR